MRYTESKERSAEVLRAALAQMGQHDAPFNPHMFAVWYEVTAGINASLSRAVEECLRSEPRLSAETMARLYIEHVEQAEQAALARATGELGKVVATMAEAAVRTGDRAGAFGEQLGDLTQALKLGDVLQIEPAISRALDRTAGMQASAAALQREVMASREEIERLRVDLIRAREESEIDPLSRLLNRKGFDLRLADLLGQTPQSGDRGSLILFDIDHFKSVNDSYGHVMGDRVIQAVAETIRGVVSDPTHSVGRYGGEEFAILLPQCNQVSAVAVAEDCRRRVGKLQIRDRRSNTVMRKVTISAGVAGAKPGDDSPGLVARADAALYAAKHAGRDRVMAA